MQESVSGQVAACHRPPPAGNLSPGRCPGAAAGARQQCRPTAPLWLAFLMLLTGCAAVGPDYQPPVAKVPAGWHSATTPAGVTVTATSPEALAHWWTVFNDPLLTRLTKEAVAGNTDLRQAQARLREARARWGASHADRFPTVDLNGSTTRSHGNEETGSGTTHTLYSASFDAKWELDLFGGNRRAEEAAKADFEASVEDRNDVLVSLLAEVARNYVDLRATETRLDIARQGVASREDTLTMVEQRLASGLATELDRQQAVTNLEQARAQIPGLETDLAQAKNRLAVLLGKPPGALAEEFAAPGPVPEAPAEIVIGVPADTLRHRPDVRRAERQFAAQTARIGEATAALYPDLSLSGSIGLDALSPSHLFYHTARSSAVGAGLNWPLIDFGAIRRNIEVQNALQEEALGNYEGTVLSALEEVENGLTAYASEQEHCQALTRATAAAANALALARAKYTAGLSDFLTVLDSQRTLLTLQDQLAASRSTIATNLISLYKALGGGWATQPAPAPTKASPQG